MRQGSGVPSPTPRLLCVLCANLLGSLGLSLPPSVNQTICLSVNDCSTLTYLPSPHWAQRGQANTEWLGEVLQVTRICNGGLGLVCGEAGDGDTEVGSTWPPLKRSRLHGCLEVRKEQGHLGFCLQYRKAHQWSWRRYECRQGQGKVSDLMERPKVWETPGGGGQCPQVQLEW